MKYILFLIAIVSLLGISTIGHGTSPDAQHCVDGFVTRTLERICDPQMGTVCYWTHENGHNVDMLSCVKL